MTFAYTESTNIVVATNGTSGTPLTFADFVTADRAGTDTDLLVAGTPASNLALAYAVRPVEDLALLVKCIVANKTAEADFIFITGFDWRGAAQTESIDVTAGNGSYTTTKYWSSITTLDCSDNSGGSGTVWGDGDLSVTQDIWGVIWDYGNGQYFVDTRLNFGNGSDSTWFSSEKEQVVFVNDFYYYDAATVLVGDQIDENNSRDGSFWRNLGTSTILHSGILKLSGSMYHKDVGTGRHGLAFNSNEIVNCIIQVYGFYMAQGKPLLRLRHVYSHGGAYLCQQPVATTIDFEDIRYYGATYGLPNPASSVALNWTDCEWNNCGNILVLSFSGTAKYINCKTDNWTHYWSGTSSGECLRIYTCDVHVSDKDGTNLSGVTVLCEDTNDAQVFNVSTAADGTITQQEVVHTKYEKDGATTNSISTTYNNHKFTISKAGYETLTLENITVDGPIDWHLELQDPAKGGGKTYIFVNEE